MPAQIVVAFASYQSVLSAGAQGMDFAPLLQLHACLFEACDAALGASKAEADGRPGGVQPSARSSGPGNLRDGPGDLRSGRYAAARERAQRRLIQMNFLEIVKALCPTASRRSRSWPARSRSL
jgi:hypothetical protein